MTGTIVTDPRPLSGGLLAFGRSLAAEGEARNVLTNLLLPYALLAESGSGKPREFRVAVDAFDDLAGEAE